MNERPMNRWVLIAAALLLSQPAFATQDIDRTVTAEKDGEVLVSNIAGTIDIVGWDRSEIRVTGELEKRRDELLITEDGSRIEIHVEVGDDHGGHPGEADLEIRLPQDSSLRVVTVSADISVDGVRGKQHLQSVSGDIDTEIWDKNLELRSVSGDATVDGNDMENIVTINLVSGDAEVRNVSGEIEVQSVSGEMELSLGDIERSRVRTTSGDMDISGTLMANGRMMIDTINGEVDLNLRDPISAEIEVETFNGDIDNCFGPEPQRTSRYGPGRELRFTQGAGNGEIRIKTMNGDVTLCTD